MRVSPPRSRTLRPVLSGAICAGVLRSYQPHAPSGIATQDQQSEGAKQNMLNHVLPPLSPGSPERYANTSALAITVSCRDLLSIAAEKKGQQFLCHRTSSCLLCWVFRSHGSIFVQKAKRPTVRRLLQNERESLRLREPCLRGLRHRVVLSRTGEGWGPAPRSCSLAGLRCWTAERVWREKAQPRGRSLGDRRGEEYEHQRGASCAR